MECRMDSVNSFCHSVQLKNTGGGSFVGGFGVGLLILWYDQAIWIYPSQKCRQLKCWGFPFFDQANRQAKVVDRNQDLLEDWCKHWVFSSPGSLTNAMLLTSTSQKLHRYAKFDTLGRNLSISHLIIWIHPTKTVAPRGGLGFYTQFGT